MDDCTLTAHNSKATDHMRVAKSTELKRELEIAGVVIASYIEDNMERDTVMVISETQAMVDKAFKHCTQLCELVDAFHA